MNFLKTSSIEYELSNDKRWESFFIHFSEDDLKDKVHPELLKMLVDFDYICRSEKIFYVICAGTLLGAVRNNGFIEWDNDIDVFVFPDGFIKIKDAIKNCNFSDKYNFILPDENEDMTLDGRFIRKNITIGDLIGDNGAGGELCIDVLEIVNSPDNLILRGLIGLISNIIHMSYNSARILKKNDPFLNWISKYNRILKLNLLFRKVIALPVIIIGKKRIYRFKRKLCNYKMNNTKYVTVPDGASGYFGEMIERKFICNSTALDFEGYALQAPIGFKTYLCNRYGENYMIPPPLEERYRKCFIRRRDWQVKRKNIQGR